MRTYVTWILVASIVSSPSLLQAGVNNKTESTKEVTLVNVELQADGSAVGQMVTDAGLAVAGTEIKVHDQKDLKRVANVARTDGAGRFVITNLKCGTLVLTVGDESYACRVWQHRTAPPKSLSSLALVSESQVVRSQNGQNRWNPLNRIRTLSSGQKLCLGLVVAAAIILPIVLEDDDKPANAS